MKWSRRVRLGVAGEAGSFVSLKALRPELVRALGSECGLGAEAELMHQVYHLEWQRSQR